MIRLPDVDRFFTVMDKELNTPAKVILTGAVAGAVLGVVRPTSDVDFEISFLADVPDILEEVVQKAVQKSGIAAQYSENIDGWSQITLLDYRKHVVPYKTFGQIEVRALSPEYLTIGKMTRYIPLDKMDVVQILQRHKTEQEKMISLWARALQKSPRSDRSRQFRDHVVDFLKTEGKKVWGASYDAQAAIGQFKTSAGIR